MAILIPDRLPQTASSGERRLFNILQKLPDDCIGYYEPLVKNRYPDFIAILPEYGLLVIEVKGWYCNNIIKANHNHITISDRNRETQLVHPIRQARDYMYNLMDFCKNHTACNLLLSKDNANTGKFFFPFGHFAILSNITKEQLLDNKIETMIDVFPETKIVTRDKLLAWESLQERELINELIKFFDPFWEIKRLEEIQINAIRAIIHPEIALKPISDISSNNSDLKILDIKQEKNARSIGSGHRIIYGVAGSGKTVLLVSRAIILSENKDNRTLLLCYNVVLSLYLKKLLTEFQNIDVLHFDKWAKRNGIVRKVTNGNFETDQELGLRLLERLQQGYGDSRKYDSILVDEAQDFEAIWFKCIKESMKEPDDGDLIIVGDANQSLYPRGALSWKALGINAMGRVIYRKFDLDKNYRNSKEILEVASLFADSTNNEDNPDKFSAILIPADCATRISGIQPALVRCVDRIDECESIIKIVTKFLSGKWFNIDCKPLNPNDIAILYPLLRKKNLRIFKNFLAELSEICPSVWINDPEEKANKTRIIDNSLKLQTIHSAKGLQYQAVIIMWIDELPRLFGKIDNGYENDKRLMYVGLTRPENYLVVTYSFGSAFTTLLSESNKIRLLTSLKNIQSPKNS